MAVFSGVAGQGECTDLRGRLISNGLHYVPGPDTCTLCVCDNGLPKVCKAVLCSPPQVRNLGLLAYLSVFYSIWITVNAVQLNYVLS